MTSACFAITLLALGDRAVRPQDLPVAVGLNLIIALVSGTQSAALERQVRELEQARRALEHQASHDGLTGLPNRARLEKYASTLDGRALTVLVLDLNGFKNINDTRGHAAGDELLRAIGERLGTTLRGGDVAGRLGGDEFLVLLPDAEPDQAAEVVARLRTEIAQPVEIDGRASAVGASIGAARREAGSPRSLTSLMAEADAAMYKEKIDITVSSEAR